jgi:hypothetical protein
MAASTKPSSVAQLWTWPRRTQRLPAGSRARPRETFFFAEVSVFIVGRIRCGQFVFLLLILIWSIATDAIGA